ncbi:TolC family protein [Haoranjiania flava]|uniref:TolC family protein n=1 Tax=Haoranjiania flava TaxID=1856322 RepID=A0AAE3LLV6_9BACT|nr:TolC family protein [Haoranjiania flava]MCU7693101.1 TolC family protein [Haoranjiania flava]
MKSTKHTLLYKSKMAEELAKNELNIYKQIVRQDLEKLFFDIESSYENYLASSEAVKSAGIAALFAQKSYEAGKSSIYDVTNSRNNLIAAKSAMLQAKYNWVFYQKLLEIYSKESK